MSDHLLFDPKAEGFANPVEITRSMAVCATLGRFLCDAPYRPLETHYKSINDTHKLWQLYAGQLGTRAKVEIPNLIGSADRLQHPSFGSISGWVGSLTLKTLQEETATRAEMYSSVLDHDFTETITMSEFVEKHILHRIDRTWHELQTVEAQNTPAILAQIASTTLLNATLRQHMHEDEILFSDRLLVG